MDPQQENLKVEDVVLPSPNAAVNQILGYGRVLEVLIGTDDDGKEITKKYHMTPVSLKDIPVLVQNVDKFMNDFGKEDEQPFAGDSMDAIGDAIVMSLKRMHPNITKEEVLENFSLGMIGAAVEIILDMNDFLSQMTTVKNKMLAMK